MPKTTYDPEMRQSESGERLYGAWKRLRKSPHDPTWNQFNVFYLWAIRAGYAIGDKLRRYDESQPYAPGNCFWQSPKGEDFSLLWALEWCEKWDETVNKLRKHFGLPPLKGGKS